MHHFFAMLSRMKFINRWGLMRNTKEESLCEHSYETAVLAHCLVMIHNRYFGGSLSPDRAAVLAIFHDASEIITGDMPTPVKYFSKKLRGAYEEAENTALDRLVSMLPPELSGDYEELLRPANEEDIALRPFVKAADKLSALIKCTEELKSGNTEFSQAEKTIRSTLEKTEMPEVRYFMEHFLPSYRLTLDEQD